MRAGRPRSGVGAAEDGSRPAQAGWAVRPRDTGQSKRRMPAWSTINQRLNGVLRHGLTQVNRPVATDAGTTSDRPIPLPLSADGFRCYNQGKSTEPAKCPPRSSAAPAIVGASGRPAAGRSGALDVGRVRTEGARTMLPQPGGNDDRGGPVRHRAGVGCRLLHLALTIYLMPVILIVLVVGVVAAGSARLAGSLARAMPRAPAGTTKPFHATQVGKDDPRPHLSGRGDRSRVV